MKAGGCGWSDSHEMFAEHGMTDEVLAQVHAVLTTGNGRMNVPHRQIMMVRILYRW